MQLKNGMKFLLALVIASSLSCRTSTPPKFSLCQGDGQGGCDGTDARGKVRSWNREELQNSWVIPSQGEAKKFVAWCYDVDVSFIQQEFKTFKHKALK